MFPSLIRDRVGDVAAVVFISDPWAAAQLTPTLQLTSLYLLHTHSLYVSQQLHFHFHASMRFFTATIASLACAATVLGAAADVEPRAALIATNACTHLRINCHTSG